MGFTYNPQANKGRPMWLWVVCGGRAGVRLSQALGGAGGALQAVEGH